MKLPSRLLRMDLLPPVSILSVAVDCSGTYRDPEEPKLTKKHTRKLDDQVNSQESVSTNSLFLDSKYEFVSKQAKYLVML